MFYEDPAPPATTRRHGLVADHIHIPIATGERFITIYQFQTLLDRARCLSPPRRLPVRRHHRHKEDRRHGRGQRLLDRAPQPALAGEHRRLPAGRRLHPQLRHPGISDPHADLDGTTPPCSATGWRPASRTSRCGFIAIPEGPGIGLSSSPISSVSSRRAPPHRHAPALRWSRGRHVGGCGSEKGPEPETQIRELVARI